ncbi:MAG: diadenylate cyclase CdaA [Bacillota bacterium]
MLPDINLINVVDILLVALLIYRLILQIRGTRAVQLIKGLIVLLVAATISSWLRLNTINWILDKVMAMVIVAIPVVFQPELRRALERLGRGKFFARPLYFLGEEAANRLAGELVRAVSMMSKRKIGALIVMERETGIYDYMETGIKIDGVVSAEFLLNIFMPNTPLHDGAVIIRGDRAVAAGCFLPLSENPDLSKDLGTRHRAGLGISEHSDALAIIVSEETGIVSVAREGRLTRNLDENALKELLENILLPKDGNSKYFWQRRS